jgi:hypothetical protein
LSTPRRPTIEISREPSSRRNLPISSVSTYRSWKYPGAISGGRVNELRPRRRDGRALGLALALQPGLDARARLLGDRLRVVDDPLLLLNPPRELVEIVSHPLLLLRGHAPELELGVGLPAAQALQHTHGRAHPGQVPAQLRDAGIETLAEVDELERVEAERQFGVGMDADRDDRFLAPQRRDPFVLAARFVAHAVGRHHEHQRGAGLDRLDELAVPVLLPRLHLPPVDPCSVLRWPRPQLVGEASREFGCVPPGVADEVVLVQPPCGQPSHTAPLPCGRRAHLTA